MLLKYECICVLTSNSSNKSEREEKCLKLNSSSEKGETDRLKASSVTFDFSNL